MDFQVSVIIPVFNAECFLRKAVESALRQPEVGEVVLVDDGSADSSLAVCETLKRENPGKTTVLWHKDHANKGPGPSRNLGLGKAKCPFIAFLDSDDWYVDGCFAFDKAAFEADDKLGLVRHSLRNAFDPNDRKQSWFIEYNGDIEKATRKYHSFIGHEVTPETYFENLYPMGNLGAGVAGTVTVRKSAALSIGGFPERDWAEDATFHAKLALISKVALAPNDPSMAMRRIHEANLTRKNSTDVVYRYEAIGKMLQDVGDFMNTHGRTCRRVAAIHRGWLRFAYNLPLRSVVSLIRSRPCDLFIPQIAFAYFKFAAGASFAKLKRILGVEPTKTKPDSAENNHNR